MARIDAEFECVAAAESHAGERLIVIDAEAPTPGDGVAAREPPARRT
jgi:hypothetical protein